MKKRTVTIRMKSGASIVMKADDVTATRNGVGELTKLEWEGSDIGLLYINLSEVEAVITNV